MRWLRREQSPRVLADYRRVSDAVHTRRAARESGAEPPALDPAEAERLARAYTPERHLGDLGEKARRLVEGARDIPRECGPEWTPKSVTPKTSLLGITLSVNLLAVGFGVLAAVNAPMDYPKESLLAGILGFVAIVLGIQSAASWRKEHDLAVACIGISLLELAAGIWFVAEKMTVWPS